MDKNYFNENLINELKSILLKKDIIFIDFYPDIPNISRNRRLILKCNKCNYIWDTTNILRVKKNICSCSNCSRKRVSLDYNLIEKYCSNFNLTMLKIEGFENGYKTKIKFKCNKCGNIFDTTYIKILKNINECGYCNLRITNKDTSLHINKMMNNINLKCKENNISFILFLDENYNSQTKLLLKCNKCGFIYNTCSYDNFIRNRKCPKCSHFINENDAINKIEEICFLRNYTFISFVNNKWMGVNTKLILKCNICGNVWDSCDYAHLLNKRGCPKCKKSHLELEVSALLNKLDISYEEQKTFHWLKYKKNLKLDFFIPKYNMVIECQGIQHLTQSNFFKNSLSYVQKLDYIKKKQCEEHGFKVIYVYSDRTLNYLKINGMRLRDLEDMLKKYS